MEAQLALQAALIRRASASRDSEFGFALGCKLTEAVTATIDVMAALKTAPRRVALPHSAIGLCLPKVPVLPEEGAPPPKIAKQPQTDLVMRSVGYPPARAGEVDRRVAARP